MVENKPPETEAEDLIGLVEDEEDVVQVKQSKKETEE